MSSRNVQNLSELSQAKKEKIVNGIVIRPFDDDGKLLLCRIIEGKISVYNILEFSDHNGYFDFLKYNDLSLVYHLGVKLSEGSLFDIREIVTITDSKFIPYKLLEENDDIFEKKMNELIHISVENEAIKLK